MDMKEDLTQASFTAENARQLQPLMESFMAGCDGGEDNWLASRLAQALPEESDNSREQIISEIEAGVSKFDSNLASLKDALEAGDTKEEWLEENLRQSLEGLSEQEYGTALFATNKALHTVNESTMATIDGTPVPATLEEAPAEEYDWSEEENRALTRHLGRVEKRKLCDTARQVFVWQGSEGAVVAELRQVFADADRRKNGRCSVQVEFINTP